LAVISGFNSFGAHMDNSTLPTNSPQDDTELIAPLTTKEKVVKYFSDLPILIDIAECESNFRQTDKDGEIFRGVRNPLDVGVMQINEKYHLKESKKLGYDIYSVEGNIAYARFLYEKEGARPWLASSKCWAKYSSIAKS
jgi:hypothetical protein